MSTKQNQFSVDVLCCVVTKLSSTGVTQKCEVYKKRIQQAEGKQNELKQVMRDVLKKMNDIKRGKNVCSIIFPQYIL